MASKELPPAAQGKTNKTPEFESQRLDFEAKIRVEFSINATKQGELDKIDEALKSRGVNFVKSSLEDKTIQLELRHDASGELRDVQTLQRFIEDETGLLTVVKGLGDLSSAVAELQGKSETPLDSQLDHVMGVMRVSQLSDGYCFFDGLLDGFGGDKKRHKYSVAVHEFGDLSGSEFETIGEPIVNIKELESTNQGKVSVRQIVPECDVPSMIGRSIAVTKRSGESQPVVKVISAGVVARASIIEGNKKQICSCSGKTLWEERIDKRQNQQS